MCPRSRHRSRLTSPWMGLHAGMFRIQGLATSHFRRRTSGAVETVPTKPAFPEACRWGRRCLVPVGELFEWAETQTGQQHRIHYRLPRALF